MQRTSECSNRVNEAWRHDLVKLQVYFISLQIQLCDCCFDFLRATEMRLGEEQKPALDEEKPKA